MFTSPASEFKLVADWWTCARADAQRSGIAPGGSGCFTVDTTVKTHFKILHFDIIVITVIIFYFILCGYCMFVTFILSLSKLV